MSEAARCMLGYDADDILTAIDESRPDAREHVLACASCRAVVAVRARAKGAWVAAMREDDASRRAESEERLAYPRARARAGARARGFVAGLAVAACIGGIAFAAWRPSSGSESASATATATAAASAAATASATAAAPASAPEPAAEAIITSACAACRLDGARFEPGAPIRDRALHVPAGAHVTIGFAIKGGLVQAANGADIDGPATARVTDGTITIEEGRARFRGVDHVKVIVPGGHIVAGGATFTVRVDATGTARVTVEDGSVSLDRGGAKAPEIVKAGATRELAHATAKAPPVDTITATVSGDPATVHAEAPNAPAPAASAPAQDPREARRASFTAAEVELANGETTRARARLEALLTAPEATLAADAATLLAGSHPVPADRAAAWARYLATSPPSPHRERAMIDRAKALIASGQTSEAKALLFQLASAPGTLTEAQKRQVERLAHDAESRP